MRNIKAFENYDYSSTQYGVQTPIKNYGDNFPLSNLSPGDRVIYLGGPYIVERVDEYHMILRSEKEGGTVKVNQNMFNIRGYISQDDMPSKMM